MFRHYFTAFSNRVASFLSSDKTDPTTTAQPKQPWPERIEKEAINQLPLIAYEGKIEIIKTLESARIACEKLSRETVLGFDTETRPAFNKGESFLPSLVQLAASDCVYLFQLGQIGSLAPLVSIFSNTAILKVGVAIHDDIKALNQIEKFTPAGFVEISTFTSPLGIVNTGLRPLCAIFLGYRISKRAQVTNWARAQLDEAQISYAATDAWISRELYQKLDELKLTQVRASSKREKKQSVAKKVKSNPVESP